MSMRLDKEKGRAAAASDLMLDIAQVAGMLGFSVRTIQRLIATGSFLAPVRLGKKPLWHRARLDAWLAGGGKNGRSR